MFQRLFFSALVFILLTPSLVAACSCLSSNATCDQTWKSGEVIFLGKVTTKITAQPAAPGEFIVRQKLGFRFSVTESFRGPAIPGDEIVVYTGRGGGDCGYPFKVGTSYLVYAYASKDASKDELTTGICSPTNPEVRVAAVVRQLRALQNGTRADDLFGTIGTAPKGVGYDDLVETTPLADIRVRVINSRGVERSTTTDQEGVYSFQSLPADTYQLKIDLPLGMSTWQRNRGDKMTIKIGAEGLTSCRTDEFARSDGSISGRVVDDGGVGVAGFVTIRHADPKEAEAAIRRGGLPGYEMEDGKFELRLLPPGGYRLFFYPKIDGKVRLDLLAGTSEILEVGFGQHIEKFRFKVSTSRDLPQ